MPMYSVTAVERDGGFTNEHGEFHSWKLMVKDGETSTECSINTRSDKPAPTVGQQIDGTLEPGKFRPKLKKNFSGGGGGGGGPRTEDPKKSAEIRRMASHKVAVELLGIEVQVALARASRGEASTLLDAITNAGASTVLPRRIEWFEGDAKAAGDRA